MHEIHDVALFRYSVLGALVSRGHLERGELKATIRELPTEEEQQQIGNLVRRAEAAEHSSVEFVSAAQCDVESLIDGTLDKSALLAEGEAIEQWLADNPSPSDTEKA